MRAALVLGMVLVAYHYSLLSLIQSLGLETPLAYLALVPLMALMLAALRSRALGSEPAVHDRQVDWILGLPLLGVALAMNLVLPKQLSTLFWVWRIDLFTLPFFVAGAVSLVFGVRTMWRQRLAITFLFLAWPLPYSLLLLRFMDVSTSLTLKGLRLALLALPVAKSLPSADGSLFQISNGASPFEVSVASACSGANGMVGFLLVGLAFAGVVSGPRLRKVLWLAGGLFLIWFVNLARIMLVFWTGKQWGESFAIDVLHPYVGLVTFNIGIIVMLMFLRPFGLRISGLPKRRAKSSPGADAAPQPVSRRLAVPTATLALTVVAALGVVLSVTNTKLKSYDLVSNALGSPKLASFASNPAKPAGWSPYRSATYTWAKPYFGETSLWHRYTYARVQAQPTGLESQLPITADVIQTSNLRSFSAYGVEACYKFHGYKLRDVAQVDLGNGVSGQALSYANAKAKQDWTVVYWIWPVRGGLEGDSTRYERVVLYLRNTGASAIAAPAAADNVKSLTNRLDGAGVDRRLLDVRSFLVAFASDVIQRQGDIGGGPAPRAADEVVSVGADPG